MKTFLTSESAAAGQSDRLCDRIAASILDEVLRNDPDASVDCEATVCRDKVHIMGEVSSAFTPDYEQLARGVIRDAGYVMPGMGFDADSCRVTVDVHERSQDISRDTGRRDREDVGSVDMCVVSGYACRDTLWLMPMPITLAHLLTGTLERVRKSGELPFLLPDGMAQVTVEYDGGRPKRIASLVLSARHDGSCDIDRVRAALTDAVIFRAVPGELLDEESLIYVNPTGRFTVGGPAAFAGLTGRKATDDAYGGASRFGGSSLTGRDPSCAACSGAFLARFAARGVVTAGLADKCEVLISYAVGLADPVSVSVDTFGTGRAEDAEIAEWLVENLDMRPNSVIRRFSLRSPIYRALSFGGCFGENAAGMPWEKDSLAEELRRELQSGNNYLANP